MTDSTVLRNGIFSTLVACGPYSSAQISACDYNIVAISSGCAIMVLYGPEESIEPQTFTGGGTTHVQLSTIQFTLEEYIQFTGDSKKFLSDIYTARDDLKRTFAKDVKLQSSACLAYLSSFKYNIDEGYEMGGKDWGVLRAMLMIVDM